MLRSLLFSGDQNTVRLVGRVFKDLEVELEHCSESAEMISNMAKRRYDAVVIDDGLSEAAAVLEKVIEHSGSKTVRIVLAEPVASVNAVFKTGTQVILYKPLSPERVRNGLRAVRNLMARERRRGAKRVETMIPARIRHGRAAGTQVFIADLSDSGASIHCGEHNLSSIGSIHVDFALPDDPERMHVTAEVIWQDSEANAGLHFLDMASSARKRLANWVKEQAGKDRHAAVTHTGI
jgi:hypothetical protein